MSYYIIFSISDALKIKFFEEGVAWARSITNSSRTINSAIHGSTKINWMNSRGSPGNQFRQKFNCLYMILLNFGNNTFMTEYAFEFTSILSNKLNSG